MNPRPAGVLRNRDFVRLWTAQTISQFGTQVSLLAIPLVAVILLKASPFEVAMLGTVEFVPFILFSLPAGAWVDRLRRRPILILGDVGRAASLASIPIDNINQLSFRQAITPTSMQGRMNATMRFIVWGTIPVGQVLGGVIATILGVHEAIWIGAAGSFLAVIPLLVTPVRTLREMPTPVDDAGSAASGHHDESPPVSAIDPPGP